MVKFGNKLESSRKDGILANTDNIYDKRTGEMQETINQKIANVSPADEEDLTKTIDEEGRSVTKFADRSYSPSTFSGKGYKILRKNIQKVSLAVTNITVNSVPSADGYVSFIINGIETHVDLVVSTDNTTALVAQKIATKLSETMTEYEVSANASSVTLIRKFGGIASSSSFSPNSSGVSCVITDTTKHEIRNLITAIMLNQPNTIYEIRYDFDLNGENIEIPEGCTLKFEGGSLKNGTIASFNIYMEKCKKENFSNIEFLGRPYIDGKEVTTRLDYINRPFRLEASFPFTESDNSFKRLSIPARRLGINTFQYVISTNTTLAAQLELINKYKITITSLKCHVSLTDSNINSYEDTILGYMIPLIKMFKVDRVYINNEQSAVVSNETTAKVLMDICDELHKYNVLVGISTNYGSSIVYKPLLDKLDIYGINFYPTLPYKGEETTYDKNIEQVHKSRFEGNIGKIVDITEAGTNPFYEAALEPASWDLINTLNGKVKADKKLSYTCSFFKTVFNIAKYYNIPVVNMWYQETLYDGRFSDVITKEGKNNLYKLFLNI